MNIKDLNILLVNIIDKRIELNLLDYNDAEYDQVEEELHDLEDDLVDKFGDELEKVFQKIHQQYCPDTDVLSPIAYLAKQYMVAGENKDGTLTYGIENKSQGLLVDSDKYEEARLLLLPNPPRMLLLGNHGKEIKEVWKSE
jgi:uncharacterized protein YydD (DUF2326 family)